MSSVPTHRKQTKLPRLLQVCVKQTNWSAWKRLANLHWSAKSAKTKRSTIAFPLRSCAIDTCKNHDAQIAIKSNAGNVAFSSIMKNSTGIGKWILMALLLRCVMHAISMNAKALAARSFLEKCSRRSHGRTIAK